MSRKSLIYSCISLVVLCVALALIPTALEAMGMASGRATAEDPRRAAAELLGADGDAPPTLAEWIESRTDDDPTQLKIVGTSDPDLSVEERVRLLEEAEKNQPDVPRTAQDGKKPSGKRTKSRQPAKVLPAEETSAG